MPIFVHAKVFYVSLFGDTNIVIINEICNVSQKKINLGFFRFLATCETKIKYLRDFSRKNCNFESRYMNNGL